MKKGLLFILAIRCVVVCFGQLNFEGASDYFKEEIKTKNTKQKLHIHYFKYKGEVSYGFGTQKILFSFPKSDEVFLLQDTVRLQSLGIVERIYELSSSQWLFLFKSSANSRSGRFTLLIYNTDQRSIEKQLHARIPIQKGKKRIIDFDSYFFFEEGKVLYVMEEILDQKIQKERKTLQLAISVYNFKEDSKKKIIDTYYGIDATSGRPIINAFEYDPETDQLVFEE